MSGCAGGRPITQLTHHRGGIGEAERTSALGVYHDLAGGGKLVSAVTVFCHMPHVYGMVMLIEFPALSRRWRANLFRQAGRYFLFFSSSTMASPTSM